MRSTRRVSRLIKGLTISVALIAGLGVGLSGCGMFSGRDDDAPVADNEILSVASDLENVETNAKITVPSGWIAVKSGLRRSTDIYARSPENQLYAAVLSESATVLNQFDLENNAEQYRWLIRRELDGFERETRIGSETIAGQPALLYEIRGRVDDVPVVYLHTTIQGTERYYQVVGWTTADSYNQNKAILREIVDSFRST